MSSNNFKIIGDINLSGDKSIAHRALLLSSFIKGKHTILNLPDNEDVETTLSILSQYGLEYNLENDVLKVNSSNVSFKDLDIYCNDSGSTARLMCGYLAGLGVDCNIRGSESLSKRPMDRIVEPLKKFGVKYKEVIPI